MYRVSCRCFFAALMAVLACSDSTAPDADCQVETNAPSAAGIALSVSPTCVSVTRGAATEFIATVSRVGGFSGALISPVDFEGLPSGVSTDLQSVTVAPPPGGANSETHSIQVSATAPVGTHTITVRAHAIGVPHATTSFKLTIR